MFLVPAGPSVQNPDPTPTPRPRPADPGAPRVTWIAPDGTEWPLTTPALGWHTLDGVTGWGSVPTSVASDPVARGGSRHQHTQDLERYITWPLRVEGATHMEFLTRWRALEWAFSQTKRLGPGRLQVFRPDGTAREVLARLMPPGFPGEPGATHIDDTAVLTLMCEDAHFRDINEIAPPPWEYVGLEADFLDPYPTVSSGQTVDGTSTVTNPGQTDAWPVWEITGPMTSLLATNHTTGEEFELTATLADNTETAVIDTYEGTVTGPDGENWFGLLDHPAAALWGLDLGVNNIEFAMSGADTGSTIRMRWRNRWQTS